MSIFVWIAVGLVAGFIGSRLVVDRGDPLTRHLGLGASGGLLGGWVLNMFGVGSFADVTPWSFVAAAIGAAAMLAVYHFVWRERADRLL